jgi:hypothetical protein
MNGKRGTMVERCVEAGLARRRTTTRQASTVGNYRRLADHAIGKLGAVKLKDLTARQVQKALAELSASLSPRSRGRLYSAPGL